MNACTVTILLAISRIAGHIFQVVTCLPGQRYSLRETCRKYDNDPFVEHCIRTATGCSACL